MNRCPDCRRFVREHVTICADCAARRDDRRLRRERIDAMQMAPYCPWPWEPCSCGEPIGVIRGMAGLFGPPADGEGR